MSNIDKLINLIKNYKKCYSNYESTKSMVDWAALRVAETTLLEYIKTDFMEDIDE